MTRIWHTVIYCLAALGVLVLVVTVSPFVEWAGARLAGRWEDPKGEVLVVLSGSLLGDDILGDSSYLRSEYAIRAYRGGTFQTLLLSGGPAPGSRPESEIMRNFLECEGIPGTSILVENRSSTTRENAIYSKPILDSLGGRKVLMTSDYHMYRAHRVFAKAGIQVLPRPIPDVLKRGSTWRGRWPAFLDLVAESIKIVYYYHRGWI